jgi:hypothetical protein
MTTGSEFVRGWPSESKEAAQLVLDQYGEPQEASESRLTWYKAGPWKRIIAQKTFFQHNFPAPHHDSVESVINYQVPPKRFQTSLHSMAA